MTNNSSTGHQNGLNRKNMEQARQAGGREEVDSEGSSPKTSLESDTHHSNEESLASEDRSSSLATDPLSRWRRSAGMVRGADSDTLRSTDDSSRIGLVSENASYPKSKAFSTVRSLSRDGSLDSMRIFGINHLKDPPEQMTMGRKIGLALMDKKWYNPHAGEDVDDDNLVLGELGGGNRLPSLKKAWAYFEHVVLTRYVVEPHNNEVEGWSWMKKFWFSFKNFDEEFERAQPGENLRPTKLYDPITTPHLQLGDFGLGFGLYFSTLRAIGYICFAAGCISSFNLYFFASDRYAYDDLSNPLLLGSAICTRTDWVPCMNCNCSSSNQGWTRTPDRCTTSETGLVLAIKNNCLDQDGVMWKLGLVNYGAMLFLLCAILGLGIYLQDQTVKFDEDEQTAQDYSILVSNPPPRATDPEAWRRYFEGNFPGVKCAAITCAVNNDVLVKALVARREVLRMMELQLDPDTPMDIDHLALLAAKEARNNDTYMKRMMAIVLPGLPELLSRLVALNTRIKGLAQLSYPCTNVFVTFEREADQRQVLGSLSVGQYHIRHNNTEVLTDQRYLFDGKLLEVAESVEPNSVRWQDLNVTVQERMDQMIVTNLLTFVAIFVVALIVRAADNHFGTIGAAFSIAGFNLAFPELAKLITLFEAHPNESKLQISLYFKIAAFRWVNTAIVITVITPFTYTLSIEGLIPQIYAIFFAEIVTTNVIQITDVYGHFQRHIMAPRAKTQDNMNLSFQGLEVELAERYTNMTKIMFLAFWYSSIFPGALFLASIALCVNYYTDRFSLMRTWKRAPHVSTEISTYSRHYFFSTACIFLAAMSSFYWSAFPFDNLCVAEGARVDKEHVGVHNVSYSLRHETLEHWFNATVEANDTMYKFCAQDYILKDSGPKFPFMYREGDADADWMDEEQQKLSILFGWTSIGVIALIVGRFLWSFVEWFRGRFAGAYEEPGDDQGIRFHDVRNINAYIPQVRSRIFSYPLIACKCDKVGEQLFDWTDPDRDYTYYDLTKDADHVLSSTSRRAKHSFSRVKHYPPNKADDIKKRKRRLERRIQMSRNVFNSVAAFSDAGKRKNSSATTLGGSTGRHLSGGSSALEPVAEKTE